MYSSLCRVYTARPRSLLCAKNLIYDENCNERLIYLHNRQVAILRLVLFCWLCARLPHLSCNHTNAVARTWCIFVRNETCICRPIARSYQHLVGRRYSTCISRELFLSIVTRCLWNCTRKQTSKLHPCHLAPISPRLFFYVPTVQIADKIII